jgi:hypothetical protein
VDVVMGLVSFLLSHWFFGLRRFQFQQRGYWAGEPIAS